ncbi:MAG: twin-arginine translocase subunit TatC [Chloroflexota bacterium]
MSQEQKITLLGHLRELRQRLIKASVAVVITTTISFFYYKQIFDLLEYKLPLLKPVFDFLTTKIHLFPPPGDINVIVITMTEGFGTIMKVCLAAGLIIAMPYLIYQLLMFILPALTPREKRTVLLMLPWITLMFAGGVAFSYFVLIPPAIKIMLGISAEVASPQIRISDYVSFVTRLLLAIGLVFEMPVVITFLARLGVVSSNWLAKQRRPAIIVAFVVAAIITPTFDPINQLLVAVPLVVLYEMSIWLAKLVEKKKSAAVAAKADSDIPAGEN